MARNRIRKTARQSATSPRPRNRAEAKQASRKALIAAATELISARGLDVSLDDLCAHAGYTRGAFYVHFKNREALITAVMEEIGQGFLDAVLGPERADAPQNIMAIVQRFIPALMNGKYPLTRKGGIRPYQLLDACARSPEIREKYVALVGNSVSRLARSVSESQRLGQMRRDVKPEQIGLLLVLVVIGTHTLYDMDVPLDLPGNSLALLKMLTP